jgi:hypothetical protein
MRSASSVLIAMPLGSHEAICATSGSASNEATRMHAAPDDAMSATERTACAPTFAPIWRWSRP